MLSVRPGPLRVGALLLALSLIATAVTACGADPTATAGVPVTRTVEVSIDGDTVTPVDERIAVQAGQRVALVIKSDSEGEVHVRSDDPGVEHDYPYEPGTTTCSFTVEAPGVVQVELRGAVRQLLVQLEVR